MEKTENENIVVLYGDGSADNNTGEYGSGVTGYIYNPLHEVTKQTSRPPKTYITTDGYLEENKYDKNKHTLIEPLYFIEGVLGYTNKGTNNVGELKAFSEPINYLFPNNKENTYKIKKVIFKSDSAYTLLVINHLLTLPPEEWRKKINANVELVEYINILIQRLKNLNVELETIKVLGHSTSYGNILADQLANVGRYSKFSEFQVIENTKNHWDIGEETPVLLRFKQLFFMSNATELNNAYAILDYNTKDEIGKKTHEAVFGVVLLANKIKYIDSVIEKYNKMLRNSMSLVSNIDMRALYSRDNYYYWSLFHTRAFRSRSNGTILGVDGKAIATNIYPSGLAVQAYEKILDLYGLLNKYINDNLEKNKVVLDVTDDFYTVSPKGKMQCKVAVGTNSVELDKEVFGHKVKIILALGSDCITRNQFKALESTIKKVSLIVSKVYDCLMYYVVIETKNNDYAIYTNIYSCKVFLGKK